MDSERFFGPMTPEQTREAVAYGFNCLSPSYMVGLLTRLILENDLKDEMLEVLGAGEE